MKSLFADGPIACGDIFVPSASGILLPGMISGDSLGENASAYPFPPRPAKFPAVPARALAGQRAQAGPCNSLALRRKG